jgi:hypothetical protein
MQSINKRIFNYCESRRLLSVLPEAGDYGKGRLWSVIVLLLIFSNRAAVKTQPCPLHKSGNGECI